jgi:hypothetical protein
MIAAIHGIGYQHLTGETEQPKWRAALAKGLDAALVDPGLAQQLQFIGYGDLFLPHGTRTGTDPPYDAGDIEPGFETELLESWYREARLTDPNLPKPGDRTKPPAIPLSVQRMLDALSQSKTFAGIAEQTLIFNLKQVRRYMSEPVIRSVIQDRIASSIPPGAKLVIAHSLGTVVAYEAICAHPEWKIEGLITMGSPLGMHNVIFERLLPSPKDGLGAWPASVTWWTNVADEGDIVAIGKRLADFFGSRVEDWVVDNGIAEVHGAEKYLATTAVGAALRKMT